MNNRTGLSSGMNKMKIVDNDGWRLKNCINKQLNSTHNQVLVDCIKTLEKTRCAVCDGFGHNMKVCPTERSIKVVNVTTEQKAYYKMLMGIVLKGDQLKFSQQYIIKKPMKTRAAYRKEMLELQGRHHKFNQAFAEIEDEPETNENK